MHFKMYEPPQQLRVKTIHNAEIGWRWRNKKAERSNEEF
jgi:hypothetical protein